jgi:plastocyanin
MSITGPVTAPAPAPVTPARSCVWMAIARYATGRLRVFGPLLAVVAGSLLIAGCADQSAAAHRPAPTPSPAGPDLPAVDSPVPSSSVEIANSSFRPVVITVRAGTTVTWTNHDRAVHRLAVKGAPTFSRRLLTGDTYAYTFDQPGAFGFVCIQHPATRGIVVVTSAGS